MSQSVAYLHQVLYVTSNKHYIFKFQNSRAVLLPDYEILKGIAQITFEVKIVTNDILI